MSYKVHVEKAIEKNNGFVAEEAHLEKETASDADEALLKEKTFIVKEEAGMRWRTHPLWLNVVADADHPKHEDKLTVIEIPEKSLGGYGACHVRWVCVTAVNGVAVRQNPHFLGGGWLLPVESYDGLSDRVYLEEVEK